MREDGSSDTKENVVSQAGNTGKHAKFGDRFIEFDSIEGKSALFYRIREVNGVYAISWHYLTPEDIISED